MLDLGSLGVLQLAEPFWANVAPIQELELLESFWPPFNDCTRSRKSPELTYQCDLSQARP